MCSKLTLSNWFKPFSKNLKSSPTRTRLAQYLQLRKMAPTTAHYMIPTIVMMCAASATIQVSSASNLTPYEMLMRL